MIYVEIEPQFRHDQSGINAKQTLWGIGGYRVELDCVTPLTIFCDSQIVQLKYGGMMRDELICEEVRGSWKHERARSSWVAPVLWLVSLE